MTGISRTFATLLLALCLAAPALADPDLTKTQSGEPLPEPPGQGVYLYEDTMWGGGKLRQLKPLGTSQSDEGTRHWAKPQMIVSGKVKLLIKLDIDQAGSIAIYPYDKGTQRIGRSRVRAQTVLLEDKGYFLLVPESDFGYGTTWAVVDRGRQKTYGFIVRPK